MDSDAVARIEDWETQPVSGGHGGLHDLVDTEFSGAVTNGSGWLFMLNGRIIGVFNGTMAAFDGVDLTAYTAPYPALPLLFAMQETGGETQAKYYTDDTPLTEVDQTLTEGGFTGYIELSENVLSGNYYVVYYRGRSLSAAFIGNAEQLLTGDEAFERANDEVGIYEVRSVDLEVEELPESISGAAATADDEQETTETGAAVEAGTEEGGSPVSSSETEAVESPDDDSTESEPVTEDPAPSEAPAAEIEQVEDDSPSDPPETAPSAPAGETETAPNQSPSDAPPSSGSAEAADAAASEAVSGSAEDPFSEEEAWRETRTIPALDPDRSEESDTETADATRQAARSDPNQAERQPPPSSQPQSRSQSPARQQSQGVQDLRAAIEARDDRIQELEANIEELVTERDELLEEREQLAEERDELENRIERLESQIESVTEEPTAANADVASDLDPGEALTQTDVFIRYGSKGDATLESAHGGRAEREAVLSNLRLEEHTRFDTDTATVNGQPYLDYLERSLQYRFVKWLVEDLIFEIQDTNSQKRLKALYNVLPRFDRAEFVGTITSRNESGEEYTETFDVVIRDRMGQPLIVADINDARDPATGEMMSDLVTRATAAAEGHETIGSAFLVTASFFEPPALETADEATGGGLLDRDSKESFVKLGRKRGFHLCLAEARDDAFHIAVPEL